MVRAFKATNLIKFSARQMTRLQKELHMPYLYRRSSLSFVRPPALLFTFRAFQWLINFHNWPSHTFFLEQVVHSYSSFFASPRSSSSFTTQITFATMLHSYALLDLSRVSSFHLYLINSRSWIFGGMFVFILLRFIAPFSTCAIILHRPCFPTSSVYDYFSKAFVWFFVEQFHFYSVTPQPMFLIILFILLTQFQLSHRSFPRSFL